MTGLGLFKQLMDFIGGGKKDKVGGESYCRRAIEDIRFGHTGFGEPNNKACMGMCGQWVEDFVEKQCPIEWFDSCFNGISDGISNGTSNAALCRTQQIKLDNIKPQKGLYPANNTSSYCSVVASAEDNSSHNIYLYIGWSSQVSLVLYAIGAKDSHLRQA